MNLVECNDIPERISTETFSPFTNVASPELSLVHEKFEDLKSTCKYFSIPYTNSTSSHNLVSNQLNILHVNARSIQSNDRFDELQVFLHRSRCVWHIICISETWLSDDLAGNREMTGYMAYFSNRNDRAGGGVALYVNKKYIKHSYCLKSDTIRCTQSLLVDCQISNSISCIIGVIYAPPDIDKCCFLDELGAYLHQINNLKKSAFVVGDYNFDLFSINSDKTVLDFFNIFASYGFWPTIFKTTRASDNRLSLLDNIFSNNIELVNRTGVIFEDFSDHFPIFASCCLQLNGSLQKSTRKIFDQRKLPDLREFLSGQLQNFCSIDDPNQASESLVQAFMVGIDKFSTIIKCTRRNSAIKPWITSAILNSINTRNVLFKERQRNPTNTNKELYARHRNCLNAVLREAKRKYIQDQLAQSKDDSKKVWDLLKTVARGNSGRSELPNQFTDMNGRMICDSYDIAESFNKFFVSIGEELQNKIPKSACSPLRHIRRNSSQTLSTFGHIDAVEVHQVIKEMRNVGAGIDDISGNIFKKTYSSITEQLVHLINICLNEGIFPENLKRAVVKPMYKSGSKNSMNNYRPISILPYISKVLEKIIHKRIMDYLSNNNILSSSQFGFQRTLSTYMPVLLLQEYITKAFENGNIAVAIFLDLKKAFDTVDPDILIQKLKQYGIQGAPLNLIQSYLTDREQCVEYNRVRSRLLKVRIGVPQGSVLGPLLFLLYINDLPNVSTRARCLLYADDTVIIYENSDASKLQADLDKDLPKFCSYLEANKLSLNTKKTVYQLYNNSHASLHFHVTLNKDSIKAVDKVKYLGMLIDPHFKWNYHIDHVSTIISRNIGIMNRSKFYLDKHSLILLYNALVLPYINYCCISWGFTFSSYLYRIEVLQKKAVRIIENQHRLAHTDPIFDRLRILKVQDIAKQQAILLMHRKLCVGTPELFDGLFVPLNQDALRNRRRQHFLEPFTKKHYRTRICTWIGPRIWNSIIASEYSISDVLEITKFNLKKITKQYFLLKYSR